MKTVSKFGIRARLFLAFGLVASMTLLASVVAWLSYVGLSRGLSQIVNNDIPAMTASALLAEKGASISATAPILIAAEDEPERAKAWKNLEATLLDMTGLINSLDGHVIADEARTSLSNLINELTVNLRELDARVRRGFWFTLKKEELTERLRWVHADFLDEVEPMVEDARFNIETALERAEETVDAAIIKQQRAILREETRKREAVLKVNASGNLAVGLIARAAEAPNQESLDDTYLFLSEVADQIKSDLKILSGLAASISLRQVTDDVLSYATGEVSIFELRRDQLRTMEEGRKLLAVNRDLVDRLQVVINGQISAVNASTKATALDSNQSIESGQALLLGVAITSLLVAVLVAWLYVGRNLVARITSLDASMREIANGNLNADVPTGGSDEISEMADALRTFRDTLDETQTELIQAGKLAALGQLSAGIAHELNQPLAAIRTYAHSSKILLDRKRSDEAQINLDKIAELTDRIAKITNHLKTFARRPSKTTDRVELAKIVENSLSLFEGRIRSENVALSLDLPEENIEVQGGEIRLEQVMVNLISNALDAMQNVNDKELRVFLSKNNKLAMIDIQDNGSGLTDEELGQLFDPFFTTKEVGEGLGLGLSISYNIIKDFGGSIRAEGRPGAGATFTITLPLA